MKLWGNYKGMGRKEKKSSTLHWIPRILQIFDLLVRFQWSIHFETVSNQTENNCKKWLNEEQVHQKNMSHEHALNLDQCKLFSENYTNGSLVMVGLQNYWD